MEDEGWPEREGAWTGLQSLARLHWPWAGLAARHVRKPERAERWLFTRLAEWDEAAPRPPARPIRLTQEAVAERLATLVGGQAETREGQRA